MMTAPYSIATRMRLQTQLAADVPPQSGQDAQRSRADNGTSLDASQEASSLTSRIPDIVGHVHPSHALPLLAELHQQRLYKDETEKRSIAVDALLSTTTATFAEKQPPLQDSLPQDQVKAEHGKQECEHEQETSNSAKANQLSNILLDEGDVGDGRVLAEGTRETTCAEVEAVMRRMLSSFERTESDANWTESASSCLIEAGDLTTVQRSSALDGLKQQQQQAAVAVQEEGCERCAPSGDTSWLQLEDSIVNARQSSNAAVVASAVSWTDWDEHMVPPHRLEPSALAISQEMFWRFPQRERVSNSCAALESIPPEHATSARFVHPSGSCDGIPSSLDYIDCGVQLVYIGSDSPVVLHSKTNAVAVDEGALSHAEKLSQTLVGDAAFESGQPATSLNSGRGPQQSEEFEGPAAPPRDSSPIPSGADASDFPCVSTVDGGPVDESPSSIAIISSEICHHSTSNVSTPEQLSAQLSSKSISPRYVHSCLLLLPQTIDLIPHPPQGTQSPARSRRR
jgi:hypothetical protein